MNALLSISSELINGYLLTAEPPRPTPMSNGCFAVLCVHVLRGGEQLRCQLKREVWRNYVLFMSQPKYDPISPKWPWCGAVIAEYLICLHLLDIDIITYRMQVTALIIA